MKLTTIWTLPGMALAERWDRTKDALALKLAARLPNRIAYWSYIRSGSAVIGHHENVPAANYTELLGRMPRTGKEQWSRPSG